MTSKRISESFNKAKAKVILPATGLIGVGVITTLRNLWKISFDLLSKDDLSKVDPALMALLAFKASLSIAAIILSGLLVYGAIQMMTLKSLSWTGAAATLSICIVIADPLCGILGIIMGFWVLFVVSKPDIRNAFGNTPQ